MQGRCGMGMELIDWLRLRVARTHTLERTEIVECASLLDLHTARKACAVILLFKSDSSISAQGMRVLAAAAAQPTMPQQIATSSSA